MSDESDPLEPVGLDLNAAGLDDAVGLDPALVGASLGAEVGLDPALAANALDADAPGLDPALDPSLVGDAPRPAFDELQPDEGAGGAGLRLSAEESEALLDAIRSGAASGGARKASLGAADEPMRRALRSADETAPRLAGAIRDALLRANAGQTETALEPSSVVTFDTLSASLDRAAAIWRFHGGDPRNPLGLVVLGSGLATAILERRLGAPSALAGIKPAERAPSPLERRVLEPIARELLASGATAFFPDPSALQLGEYRPETETLSRFAPCLRMLVQLTLKSGTSSEVMLVLFGSAFSTRPTGALGSGRAQVMEAVSDVEVSAIAILGRCRSTVRGLLSLEAGAVLRLDGAPDRPIEVHVDGVAVLRGMPVVKDGNMAIEVRT